MGSEMCIRDSSKAEVLEVFSDPYRLSEPLGMVNGEERHALFGATIAGRVVKAIYTWRGDNIRIVTAFPIRRGSSYRAYRAQPRGTL